MGDQRGAEGAGRRALDDARRSATAVRVRVWRGAAEEVGNELRRRLARDIGPPDRATIGGVHGQARVEAREKAHDVVEVAQEEELRPRAVDGRDDLREVDDRRPSAAARMLCGESGKASQRRRALPRQASAGVVPPPWTSSARMRPAVAWPRHQAVSLKLGEPAIGAPANMARRAGAAGLASHALDRTTIAGRGVVGPPSRGGAEFVGLAEGHRAARRLAEHHHRGRGVVGPPSRGGAEFAGLTEGHRTVVGRERLAERHRARPKMPQWSVSLGITWSILRGEEEGHARQHLTAPLGPAPELDQERSAPAPDRHRYGIGSRMGTCCSVSYGGRVLNPHQLAAAQAAKTLLETLSTEEVRTLGIEALRQWRRRPILPPRDPYRVGPPPAPDPMTAESRNIFQVHGDLGIAFVRVLAERKQAQGIAPNKVKEAFINDEILNADWMAGFVEFLWWLLRAGLAVELRREHRDQFALRDYPTVLRLTERGARMLDDPDPDDNPMVPGCLDRIRLRCPDLPDGVLALLADGRACLDVGLLRPAVVMMGVAYELAIEAVIGAMINKQLLPANTLDRQAAARLRAVLAS